MAETGSSNGLVPSAADEARFWALVESAWQQLGDEPASLRRLIVGRDPEAETSGLYDLDGWLDQFMAKLAELCAGMSSEQLTDLDRVVERKLYDIDRADIQAVTDGSDDGFLYCRGYIVAVGREFYEAVKADPRMAILDAECESMCYFFAKQHDKHFGGWPETGSNITRESVSNPAGWDL